MQTIIQIHFRAQMKLNYNNVSEGNPAQTKRIQASDNGGKKHGKPWKWNANLVWAENLNTLLGIFRVCSWGKLGMLKDFALIKPFVAHTSKEREIFKSKLVRFRTS